MRHRRQHHRHLVSLRRRRTRSPSSLSTGRGRRCQSLRSSPPRARNRRPQPRPLRAASQPIARALRSPRRLPRHESTPLGRGSSRAQQLPHRNRFSVKDRLVQCLRLAPRRRLRRCSPRGAANRGPRPFWMDCSRRCSTWYEATGKRRRSKHERPEPHLRKIRRPVRRRWRRAGDPARPRMREPNPMACRPPRKRDRRERNRRRY